MDDSEPAIANDQVDDQNAFLDDQNRLIKSNFFEQNLLERAEERDIDWLLQQFNPDSDESDALLLQKITGLE